MSIVQALERINMNKAEVTLTAVHVVSSMKSYRRDIGIGKNVHKNDLFFLHQQTSQTHKGMQTISE